MLVAARAGMNDSNSLAWQRKIVFKSAIRRSITASPTNVFMQPVLSSISASLLGQQRSQSTFLDAASRIATGNGETLVEDWASLALASKTHAANLAVLRTFDDMEKDVLNILA